MFFRKLIAMDELIWKEKNTPQNNPLRKIPHYFIIFLKQRVIFVELFLRFL
jgi:hypothetical protein